MCLGAREMQERERTVEVEAAEDLLMRFELSAMLRKERASGTGKLALLLADKLLEFFIIS